MMKRYIEIGIAILIAVVIGFLEGKFNLQIMKIALVFSIINIIITFTLCIKAIQTYIRIEIRSQSFCEANCPFRFKGLFFTIIFSLSYAICETRWLYKNLSMQIGGFDTLIWLMTEFLSMVALFCFIGCMKEQVKKHNGSV